MQRYITLSIELHLFFARIMKEHSLFLEAGFTPKNKNLADEAEWFKNEFERFLLDVVSVSNGVVDPNILNSGEIVTKYTLDAENKTEFSSGIPINKMITEMESSLQPRLGGISTTITPNDIQRLNNRALELVDGLINFKERLLDNIFTCNLFTVNYPLLIEHILREAKLYRSYIVELETNHDIVSENLRDVELFWNQIMMEHALFIRGLLDPTEAELINTANNFASEYKELLMAATKTNDTVIANFPLQETIKYKGFKTAATEGLLNCKIKSIILPLLGDHVLREANHYLRLLNEKSINPHS